LHGDGIVENSRASFEAAIAGGFGVETDVQVSKDGVAFVFHDYELDRLTKKSGPVADRKAAKLEKTTFKDCDETLPRLSDMLALVDGQAPILIEIKSGDRKVKKLCRSVAECLAAYPGEAAVMSFNPEVGRWFASNAPDVIRGLVVTEHEEVSIADKLKGAMKRSFSVFRAEPHFVAYDIRDLPSDFAASLRARELPVLTWTVRTNGERKKAAECADQIIFEVR
jgi:glycerophosphoryl diester phosphodiesterase